MATATTQKTIQVLSMEPGTSIELGRQRCRLCKRPTHKVKGRGRPKEVHTNCCVILSRMKEIEERMRMVEWQSMEDAQRFRGEFTRLANALFNRPSDIKLAPNDERDF